MAIYYKLHGRILMPQVGKKHFSYTPKGKAAAKKYAKKVGTKLQEVGTVTALDIKRKRERKPSDFLSVGKRTTKRAANVGFETPGQRQKASLSVRQSTNTGKLGGGATRKLKYRKMGITAGTEMNWKDKLVEDIRKKSKTELKKQFAQAGYPRKHGTLPRVLGKLRRAGVPRIKESDWIQGAVNPKHKGFCTPMTKKTCTPARKALAKRFKKAGRKEKKSGGTGWEGKV